MTEDTAANPTPPPSPFVLGDKVYITLTPSWRLKPHEWTAAPLPADAHKVKIDRKTWMRLRYVRPLEAQEVDAPPCWGMCAMGWLAISCGLTPLEIYRTSVQDTLSARLEDKAKLSPLLFKFWTAPPEKDEHWTLRRLITCINDAPLFNLAGYVPALQPHEGDRETLARAKEEILTLLFTGLGVRLEFEGEVDPDNLPPEHALV